jgi:hypothetical protein
MNKGFKEGKYGCKRLESGVVIQVATASGSAEARPYLKIHHLGLGQLAQRDSKSNASEKLWSFIYQIRIC